MTNLPKSTQDLIDKVEANKPAARTVKVLEDMALITEDISNSLAEMLSDSKSSSNDLGVLLLDIRESLQAIKGRKDPDMPDFAKPITDKLSQLDKTIEKTLKGINFTPQISVPEVKVDAPQVTVETPEIDTREIEKILKKLPDAFEKAIKALPQTEVPETDLSPLVEINREMSEKLSSIDIASRMKVQFPESFQVSNPITGYATEATLQQIRDDEYGLNDYEVASATITYVGKERNDGAWMVTEIDSTTGYAITYATVANNPSVTTYTDAWTDRATLTYGSFSGAF